MFGRRLASPQPPTLYAFAVGLSAGALALAAPPIALLVLAALAAHALMAAPSLRIDLVGLAGPALAALAVGAFIGLAHAVGVLFLWRMFADTRWSVREAARLAEAAGRPREASQPALLHAWLTPAYCVALVAFTAPHMVAGLPLDLPHLPFWAPLAIGALGAGAVFDWLLRRAADWRLGELAPSPALHLLTHHGLFVLALGCAIDVSAGLVALAAWRLAHAAPLRLPQPSFTAVP